ncbi:MAG: ATPase, partial [Acaryochloridaceae cyanobacterium CSU_5_19]|nr:ATPase [Acaryochloridaceae cyanobacterium CSU_5_19]
MPLPPTSTSTPYGNESPQFSALVQQLQELDGMGYKAYKSLRGSYQFANFTLIIDRVQGDPFAKPSQCRVQVPQGLAGFLPEFYANRSRELGLRDYLARQLSEVAEQLQQRLGTGNSGLICIAKPGPEILERSAILVNDQEVEARFRVGLPAQGRRIDGRGARRLLCELIPLLVQRALHYSALSAPAL